MEQAIKNLRVTIDGLATQTLQAKRRLLFDGENMNRANYSLNMAKGWLGKALAEIGTNNPYKVASKVSGIPPTADVDDSDRDELFINNEEDLLNLCNRIRTGIKEKALPEWEPIFESLYHVAFKEGTKLMECLLNSWNHLQEASMNLGFELQAIRDRSQERDHE